MQRNIDLSSVPEMLTFYSGGLNLGVFYPGPPIGNRGSELLGNPLTGKAQTYRAVPNGDGNKRHAWVLIVAPTDIEYFQLRQTTTPISVQSVSSYDGYFNKIKSSVHLHEKIMKYKKGGYRDWYIPSRDELAFMAKNIPDQFELGIRFHQMKKTKYISSSYAEQNIRSKKNTKKLSLAFSQSFDLPTYGDTLLVSDTRPMTVRLVRRIPVYIK